MKSALAHVGIDLSEYRLVVNLAPADLRKTGSGFDVAIAIATRACLGVIPHEPIDGVLFLCELSLSGDIQPVRGALPKVLGARQRGLTRGCSYSWRAIQKGERPVFTCRSAEATSVPRRDFEP